MKKEKIIDFIDKLLSSNFINDPISVSNYNFIREVISNIDLHVIKNFKYIIKKSIPIIEKIYDNYKKFSINNLKEISVEDTNYNLIRNELHNFPSFDDKKGVEIIKSIEKIKKKYSYQLTINDININVFFYAEKEEKLIFINLARIIYVFISTFGVDQYLYNEYNIRLLMIDFPRKLNSKTGSNLNSFKELSEKGYFNNSSGVHIARKKELVVSRLSGLSGLLIHELIHMLGLDFCFNFKNRSQINLNDWEKSWIENNNIKLNNNNIISFIESICNTNSSYFVAIYNAIHLSYLNDKPNKVIKYFKYLFYIESIYCYINGIKLLNYFGFTSYDSFFNSNNNKIFYQNALVFEYIILRMFLIYDYYKLLMKPLLQVNFNKDTDEDYNLNFQAELNKKLLNINQKKYLKKIFDEICNIVNSLNDNSMEYFPLDILN